MLDRAFSKFKKGKESIDRTQKRGARTLAVTFFLLVALVSSQSAQASRCDDFVDIEANNTDSDDSTIRYHGDVQIESGSLIVRGAEVKVERDDPPTMVFDLRNATFSINDGKESVHGLADRIVFHAKDCILDLIGYALVETGSNVQEYDTVRYFLDKDEIAPLWLYIDQGVPIAPE